MARTPQQLVARAYEVHLRDHVDQHAAPSRCIHLVCQLAAALAERDRLTAYRPAAGVVVTVAASGEGTPFTGLMSDYIPDGS